MREDKKKRCSERRRKLYTIPLIIQVTRIRRNDALKGDGNQSLNYDIYQLYGYNKKKRCSERRRKLKFLLMVTRYFIKIRRNDALKGDGNFFNNNLIS